MTPYQGNQSEPVPSIGEMTPWLGFGHPSANANALVPPAMAPHIFQPASQASWTMAQAGVPNASPFEHFSAAAAQPLSGEELAARVAAVEILASQRFQPDNYPQGWPQPLLPQLKQAPMIDDSAIWGQTSPQDVHFLQQQPTVAMTQNGNSAAVPVEMNSYGGTSWASPMLPPAGSPTSWPAPPPVQQPGGGQASWAPPAQLPGEPGKKTFEYFLMESGILDKPRTFDDILSGDGDDDVLLEELINDMLGVGDGPADLGPVEGDGYSLLASAGGGGLAPGAGAGLSSGPRGDQQAVFCMGGGGRDEAAAAEARERRSRRMAKRKEVAARARRPASRKRAAARGRQGGDQGATGS